MWMQKFKEAFRLTTLKMNSHGTLVQLAQEKLVKHGISPGAIDGIFGKATWQAVKAFQVKNKLSVNGIIESKTWSILLKEPIVKPSKGAVPYLSQKDPRWATKMYSSHGDKSQTIASSGCGPTSMAMVISALAKQVTPIETCKFAIDNNFRSKENGTEWAFFTKIATKYGLKSEQTYSTNDVIWALKAGKIVIANMGKGYFTKGGHYIVLTGIVGDTIMANDPASKVRDKALVNIFREQTRTYFIFSK